MPRNAQSEATSLLCRSCSASPRSHLHNISGELSIILGFASYYVELLASLCAFRRTSYRTTDHLVSVGLLAFFYGVFIE
jgi:hypothetical protein